MYHCLLSLKQIQSLTRIKAQWKTTTQVTAGFKRCGGTGQQCCMLLDMRRNTRWPGTELEKEHPLCPSLWMHCLPEAALPQGPAPCPEQLAASLSMDSGQRGVHVPLP